MDKITSKWNSFLVLTEQNRSQIFDNNIKKIYNSLSLIERNNATVYSSYLNESTKTIISFDAFYREIQKIPNFSSVLSQYIIDSFLGAGGVGIAFSLLEPHENYILKLQIVREKIDSHLTTTGASYNQITYNRQQNNVYKRNELNILEAFSGMIAKFNNHQIVASIFVISKLQDKGKITTNNGTYDLEELKKDFFKFTLTNLIKEFAYISYYKNIIKTNIIPRQFEIIKNNIKNNELAKQVINYIKNDQIDLALKIIYNIYKSHFKILTEDMFIIKIN